MKTNQIVCADAFEWLREAPAESVHAVVTDPPYGLAFMGRDWDDFEPREYQAWCEKWAALALDVLKPGGHLLAFSGNRTHHRLFSGVEDAGFEIRDTLTWHYGCLSDDTEVLTPNGWRSHDEIAAGDEVVAFDPDTETFAAEPTDRVFRYDHDGEMVRYQSPHTDQLVTPNHRVLHRRDGWETIYATDSNDIMELPVIHAPRKSEVRLPGGKGVRDLPVGIRVSRPLSGKAEQNVWRSVLYGRTQGVESTVECNTPLSTRWEGRSRMSQLRDNGLDIQIPRKNQRQTFLQPEMLRRVAVVRRGLGCSLKGDSPQRGTFTRRTPSPFRTDDRREEPGVEGRRDVQAPEGKLQARDIGPVPAGVRGNGAGERVRPRTPIEGGEGNRPAADQHRGRSPHRPRQPQQRLGESGVVAEQPASQARGGQPGSLPVRTTLARTSRVDYSGVVWCVKVPSSYFVARRNGQAFITGNSGFPKALDVSKAIDKAAFNEWLDDHPEERERLTELSAGSEEYYELERELKRKAGAEREVVGERERNGGPAGMVPSKGWNDGPMTEDDGTVEVTAPATDAAREWDGWKTALKPATEFIVLARKPFSGTVAENVQAHGTGALNIDGCRVGIETVNGGNLADNPHLRDSIKRGENVEGAGYKVASEDTEGETHDEGRYPANVIFDAEAAAALDREVGELGESKGVRGQTAPNGKYGEFGEEGNGKAVGMGDTGGPSRYFYTSKATRAERTLDGRIDNAHPTVKPVDLMEWLVKLVTAEGQIVLDPFAGTGTTCRAAKNLGREFVGIEKQAKWADVARVRCGLGAEDPAHIRADDAQTALSAFDVDT